MLDICVVIVAYNSAVTLTDCLDPLMRDPDVSTIVVVDNSSDTETARIVSAAAAAASTYDFPEVVYLASQGNVGFARGCNLGADASRSRFILFLNPDVSLTRPLAELVGALEGVGGAIVAGQLVVPGCGAVTNARTAANLGREFIKAAIGSRAYRTPKRKRWGKEPRRVGQVDGAMMLLARDSLERLSGFDERFELYYEDVDLCERAQLHGGVFIVPGHWGAHVGGASSATISDRSYAVLRVSRIRYLRKKYGNKPWVSSAAAVLAILEFGSRTLTGQRESVEVRARSVALQLREIINPGSVWVLPQNSRHDCQ